jgi:hypothetical protein
VDALHPSIVLDAQYAPDILILRFTRWPSLADQKAMLRSLVDAKHLTANSSALLNITALAKLPDPDALAGGLAQAQGQNSVLKRIACVVQSNEQAHFVETLRRMAPLPNNIGVFFSDADGLQWLMG